MSSTTLLKVVELLAPVSAITASTAILGYSAFLSPVLISTTSQSSPSLALRQLRPYFETGKYIFPPASVLSTTLFGILAYSQPDKAIGFSLAAAGCFSIMPFTTWYMIPVTNNQILELDDRAKKGDQGVEEQRGRIKNLLTSFAKQNVVRGGMYWIGGVIGLYTILA